MIVIFIQKLFIQLEERKFEEFVFLLCLLKLNFEMASHFKHFTVFLHNCHIMIIKIIHLAYAACDFDRQDNMMVMNSNFISTER